MTAPKITFTNIAVLVSLAGLSAAPGASGQTLVREGGRAFDAPGTTNALNTAFGSSDPLSVSSSLSINAFSNPNLRSLSASIDVNDTLFVPSTGVVVRNSSPFSLRSSTSTPPLPSQPSAFSTSGFSTASPPQLFTVEPLNNSGLPSVPTIPRLSDFGRSALSLTLPPPTQSFATTFVNTGISDTINSPGDFGRIAPGFSFDEEDTIGVAPAFRPSAGLPPTDVRPPRAPSNPLVQTLTGDVGKDFVDYGSALGVGLTGGTDTTNDALQDRLQAATAPSRSVFSVPKPPSLGTGLPPQPLTPRNTSFQSFNATPLTDVAPETSFIEETLRQAQSITRPDIGALPAGPPSLTNPRVDGGFGLNPIKPPLGFPNVDLKAKSVYGEMQEAVDWIQRLKTRQKGLTAAADSPPVLAESRRKALSYVRATADEPLSSFVGNGTDPAGQFAKTAEQYLKTGHYARAVAQYDVALVADRNNPLLLLGQAHALIGSGDLFRAIRKITKAIEAFPEVAYFKIDLNQFINDPDLLEIRRAGLETRLATREDYRLRFLLGYIEYYSGLPEFGMKNLEAAAASAPVDSAIARFPHAITVGEELRKSNPPSTPTP